MIERTILDKLLRRMEHGHLRITYWDGDTRGYGDSSETGLHITIRDKKVVRSILKSPSLGVGEAYMDGNLTVEGSLELLPTIAHQNRQLFADIEKKAAKIKLHRNTKSTQRKYIAHHYDLGNDFYKLWLDSETFGYSCAYFKTPDDTLEQAQIQKFDYILDKLRLEPGQEILDIGFGWGYLLLRAAQRFGVKGFGVTLSEEQHAFAVERAKREKVDHLVTYELMNYQDLPKLKRQFDRVASIGFFEHVGRGSHATYFEVIDKVLKPDGISVLHSITSQVEGPNDPWVDKYIFPGGYIPSIRETTAHLPDYNFVLKDYENLGPHYARTLEHWLERFDRQKNTIIDMYDERFYRMWRFYLATSIAAFRNGTINLSQWTFTRSPGLDWPLTRDYLYKNSI